VFTQSKYTNYNCVGELQWTETYSWLPVNFLGCLYKLEVVKNKRGIVFEQKIPNA